MSCKDNVEDVRKVFPATWPSEESVCPSRFLWLGPHCDPWASLGGHSAVCLSQYDPVLWLLKVIRSSLRGRRRSCTPDRLVTGLRSPPQPEELCPGPSSPSCMGFQVLGTQGRKKVQSQRGVWLERLPQQWALCSFLGVRPGDVCVKDRASRLPRSCGSCCSGQSPPMHPCSPSRKSTTLSCLSLCRVGGK